MRIETEKDREVGYTGKEMCETIVEALKTTDMKNIPTPEQIWNRSPTGELADVIMMHDWAMVTLGRRDKSIYSELGGNNS